MSVPPRAENKNKVYVSPELTTHGDVEELTRAIGNRGNKDNSLPLDKYHRTL